MSLGWKGFARDRCSSLLGQST